MGLCPSTQTNSCLIDTSWVDAVQIASSFAFSSRTATTAYSRSDGKLLTVENASQGIPQTISPADLFFVLNTLFSSGPLTPAQVAAEGFTIVDDFVDWVWSYANQYVTYGSLGGVEDFFRSLITMPLLWSQVNGLNFTLTAKLDGPVPGLPSNLYSTAVLAKSESRIVIARWTVIVFTALGWECFCGVLCS